MNTSPEPAPEYISLVTYNVQFNRALSEVGKIIKKYSPDVICLQEVNLGKRHLYEPLFPGYVLAATSNSFYRMGKTFGLATFYRSNRFYQMGSKSIFLPRTYYELCIALLTWRGPRTALRTDIVTRSTMHKISVYNLHLTALVATNKARNKQLRETFEDLELHTGEAAIIMGDFNYPFRKRGLERIARSHGLTEASAGVLYTWKMNILWWKLRWKFDFVLSKNLIAERSQRLDEYRASDHFPVFTRFRL
ncbi:MAG: endonuclease/exonuclease/phosphatase family protein [Candidatus Roizmanbacteria bacterium]